MTWRISSARTRRTCNELRSAGVLASASPNDRSRIGPDGRRPTFKFLHRTRRRRRLPRRGFVPGYRSEAAQTAVSRQTNSCLPMGNTLGENPVFWYYNIFSLQRLWEGSNAWEADVTCAEAHGDSRLWHTAEAVHIDVRGLEPPNPMVQILRVLDEGEVGLVVIAHLDREPIFLYPELDDRGWSHEIVSSCGSEDCEGEIKLRLVRLT